MIAGRQTAYRATILLAAASISSVAAPQTEPARPAERKDVAGSIQKGVGKSRDEMSFRFNRTVIILRDPTRWFSDRGNLDQFASTLAGVFGGAMADPRLAYLDGGIGAERKAASAFRRAVDRFAFGAEPDGDPASPNPPGTSPWKLSPEFEWQDWVLSGLQDLSVGATLYNSRGSEAGSYTRCEAGFGFDTGILNRLETFKIKLAVGSGATVYRAGVGWRDGFILGAYYQKRF